jgi:hypothetical protein
MKILVFKISLNLITITPYGLIDFIFAVILPLDTVEFFN